RLPAGDAASGAPWNTTLPVKGCEPLQKKSAGIGSLAKLVCANPATVIHRSTPRWMESPAPAKASEPPIRARSKAPGMAGRIQGFVIFILRSFPIIVDRCGLRPGRPAGSIYKKCAGAAGGSPQGLGVSPSEPVGAPWSTLRLWLLS